jgi:hypothetical protein
MATKTYPVPLVGEQHYQDAVELLELGEEVFVRHQPHNPYDAMALAAVDAAGDVIGYVPKDCFLRGAVFEQGKACSATVRSLEDDERGHGFIHVYLDIELCDGPIDTCEYVAAR